jgi:hypothetical protein
MTDQIENTEVSAENATSAENAPVETVNETSFLDQITDEEIKGSKSLSNFKDINGLAKSYINLEKKLGAPKEPENYAPEDYTYELPENYQANDDLLNLVKDKSVELGIKPEAFKQLVETFTGEESKIIQGIQADNEARINELQNSLKEEWGNSYDDNLKIAENTFKRFATEEDQEQFASLSPEGQLAVAKIMHNVSQQIGEGTQGKVGNSQGGLTKEDALVKISEIRNDRTIDPNVRDRELAKLYPIAYANETGESLGVVTGFSRNSIL